jgi:hypothetical protein
MKLNKNIIWNIVGMILITLSYVFLEKGNPHNIWNKVLPLGLFLSFVFRLVLQIKKNK